MKAIISTEGMSASVRLPANRRQMTGALASVGLQHTLPYELPANGIKDDYTVTLKPEDKFDEYVIALSDKGTLALIHTMYDLLDKLSFNKRNEVESKVINGDVESYSEFRDLLRESLDRPIVATFYFPLTVSYYSRNSWGEVDDDPEELDGSYAYEHREKIRNAFLDYTSNDEENMAEYFSGHNGVASKLLRSDWDFECRRGELYGKVVAQLSEPFTSEEEIKFKDFVSSQNSDGLGEGFEQQDIEMDGSRRYGLINVHFWDSEIDYFVDNADEFAQRLNSQDFGMGGM